MTTELTPAQHTDYAARPWGTFVPEMDAVSDDMRYDVMERMSSIPWNNDTLGRFARLINTVLGEGLRTREDVVNNQMEGRSDYYYYNHENRLAAWHNDDEDVFMVIEYNKVRGLTPRKYRPVAFLKKVIQKYYTDHILGDLLAEDVSAVLTELLPKGDDYTIEVRENASDLYHHSDLTHMDSCMIFQPYVYFYDQPNVKGLVARNTEGKAVARCILWTLDDGRRTVDRIYYCDSAGRRAIIRWCSQNNVLGTPPEDAQVTMPVHSKGYPYMDNFYYGVRLNDVVVLFTDHYKRQEYVAALPKETFYEMDTVHSTGGGNPDWTENLVEHEGRMVYASRLLKDERNGVTVYVDDLEYPEIHTLHTFPANHAFRCLTGDYRIVYADQLYGYHGMVYTMSDDDVFIDDCRVPHEHVRALLEKDADGWTVRLITHAEFSNRRYINGPERLYRFYSLSSWKADSFLAHLAQTTERCVAATRYSVVITADTRSTFEEDAAQWYRLEELAV